MMIKGYVDLSDEIQERICVVTRDYRPFITGWTDKQVHLCLLHIAMAAKCLDIQVEYSSLARSIGISEYAVIQSCRRLQRQGNIYLGRRQLGDDCTLQRIRVLLPMLPADRSNN